MCTEKKNEAVKRGKRMKEYILGILMEGELIVA